MVAGDYKRKLTAILQADVMGYGRLKGDDEEATETLRGGDLAAPLVGFLRQTLNAPSLDFEKEPTLLTKGGQAQIFALFLSDPHKETEWGGSSCL